MARYNPRLKQGDQRLNAFFTSAPAGLAILDRELRYVQLNETLAQMNGPTVAEHLGRQVRDVLPELAPVVEPILTRILATGQPALNIEVSGETPAQPGVTRHWLVSYFALPGRRGKPEGIGAIVVEDTARRQAEQARRRSGAEYRAIVENATNGIYRSSLDGRFLKVNPALVRMLGYESEAEVLALAIGRDVYADPDQRLQLVERDREAQSIRGVEVEWKRKDGHRILVRLSGRPVRSEHGDLLGFEMIAEDVTEQRALEQAVRQAQKMETVGQLTSGIAHDFNNLLTVIFGHARLLGEALPQDRDDLRGDLSALEAAARRGADLVHKLLGFSRRERLEIQPIDVAPLVQEATATLRRILPSNIEIKFEPHPDAGIANADPGALQQVLLNLATNARDAMPTGGTLHVEVRRTRLDEEDRRLHAWIQPGPYVCIAVSDTGVGMDEETQASVFEPFFTTKPPGVGTGLGMSMVYGLVKQHQGFVHLYSELGQGTTVKLYFPLAPNLAVSSARAEREGALLGGSETILLVEDDERLRNVATRLLEKVGYRVVPAADGVYGLENYRTHRSEIDLVVTDLMMPRTGGLELFRALREDQSTLKVLFTSGYAARDLKEAAGADANVAFLTKPWTASELLLRVRALLDGSLGEAR